jgi:hypothetical protein
MGIVMSVHKQPPEGNFCDEHGRVHKPITVKPTVGTQVTLETEIEWLTAIQTVTDMEVGKKIC